MSQTRSGSNNALSAYSNLTKPPLAEPAVTSEAPSTPAVQPTKPPATQPQRLPAENEIKSPPARVSSTPEAGQTAKQNTIKWSFMIPVDLRSAAVNAIAHTPFLSLNSFMEEAVARQIEHMETQRGEPFNRPEQHPEGNRLKLRPGRRMSA